MGPSVGTVTLVSLVTGFGSSPVGQCPFSVSVVLK